MIAVLGFGRISFLSEKMSWITQQKIANSMRQNEAFSNVHYDIKGKEISFEMGGNKGIDYVELEKVKLDITNKNISVEISVNEYTEGETGYYYHTEDETKEVENVST